jgi:hypothetical protein
MSDLTFTGGNFGICEFFSQECKETAANDIWIDGGSQQFTSQRLSFSNVNTAVQLIWDWGWVSDSYSTRHVCPVTKRLT